MNVIHMMGKILIISNPMFPKSPLPYHLFAFVFAAGMHGGTLFGCHLPGKCPFDVTPTD